MLWFSAQIACTCYLHRARPFAARCENEIGSISEIFKFEPKSRPHILSDIATKLLRAQIKIINLKISIDCDFCSHLCENQSFYMRNICIAFPFDRSFFCSLSLFARSFFLIRFIDLCSRMGEMKWKMVCWMEEKEFSLTTLRSIRVAMLSVFERSTPQIPVLFRSLLPHFFFICIFGVCVR